MSHNDTELSEYSGLIIDEAHERSVNIDLLLLLAKLLVRRRPNFKLIIMSATIDPQIFKKYYTIPNCSFDIYIPKVKTSPYKVDLKYTTKKIKIDNAVDETIKMIDKILINTSTGGVLVFVTSISETHKVCNYIRRKIEEQPNYYPYLPYCVPLYGDINEKSDAFKIIEGVKPPPEGYDRRIIISTNVAESSITFTDMVYIIDSGLRYEKYYDPTKYAYIGGKVYVARANIKQRCGRTGRTNAGVCVKMYTKEQYDNFPHYLAPEIEKADITETLLRILNLPFIGGNLNNGYLLLNELITTPTEPYIARGVFNLYYLGLLDIQGNITKLGRIANRFGKFSPQIARMLIAAYYLDCLPEAIVLGAIISETDALDDWFIKPPNMDKNPKLKREYIANIKQFAHPSGDHMTLLNVYLRYLNRGSGNTWINRSQRKWISNHNLNEKTIANVNSSIKDLRDSVRRNIKDIVNLQMFEIINQGPRNKSNRTTLKKPLEQYGGTDVERDEIRQRISNTDINNLRNTLYELNSVNNKISIGNFKIPSFFDNSISYSDTKYNTTDTTEHQLGSGKKKTKKNIKDSKKRRDGRKGKKGRKDKKKSNKKKAINPADTKLIKYLDNISLHDFRQVKINKYPKKSDNIISALFFGFYMNMGIKGSSDTQSKKYMVKIANHKASVSGCVLDLLKKPLPKLIMYKEYYIVLGKDKLNLITKIPLKTIANYINNNKLKI